MTPPSGGLPLQKRIMAALRTDAGGVYGLPAPQTDAGGGVYGLPALQKDTGGV